MYLTQNLKSSMATCVKTGLEQSNNERPMARRCPCSSIRCWLLVWASLRLAWSVLRTGALIIMTYRTFDDYLYNWDPTYISEIRFELIYRVVGLALQLLEFGMIVTFIVAGVKRSAMLYRLYLRYCILSLIVYITAVVMDYEVVDFGQIYLSYQLNELMLAADNDAIAFGVSVILNIGLESLLIYLIKRLINKYSYVETNVSFEKV